MFEERLRQARKRAKLTQKQISDKLFLSQQAYGRYEAGTASPNPETLAKICEILGVSSKYLLGAGSHPDAPKSTGGTWIPVLGTVAAGIPVEAIEDITGWEEIKPNMYNIGELFALRVKGQSMEPKFSEGDVVIVKKQPDVDNGDVAVVIINGEDATLKRIKKSPEGIMLIPSNRAFEPKYFTNKEIETLPVTILGKVVELRAKF